MSAVESWNRKQPSKIVLNHTQKLKRFGLYIFGMDMDEFESELRELFSTSVTSVYDVDVFENDDGLRAWVVLEEGDELVAEIGESLRDDGYYILNHQGESRYVDAERDGYLVACE